MTPKNAEMIAIKGLQYLASDEEQLGRFLSLSGCDPAHLRENATSPDFLLGVLEFFMGNEPTLLAFSSHNAILPQEISTACQILSGNSDEVSATYESHSI